MDDEQEPNELRDIRDVQPTSFRQIIGQEHVKKALEVAVEASFAEHKRLDDVLLCGPPGLGKTGLATVLQHELGLSQMTAVLAQSISNTAELNSVLLSATNGLLLLMRFIFSRRAPSIRCSRFSTLGPSTSIPARP
jgi:Holliday junction DNA helicase RuvB